MTSITNSAVPVAATDPGIAELSVPSQPSDYHLRHDNVTFTGAEYVVTYLHIVNRFPTKPTWMKTTEHINQLFDQVAGAGRNVVALRQLYDRCEQAATVDSYLINRGDPYHDVAAAVAEISDPRDRADLFEMFSMRLADQRRMAAWSPAEAGLRSEVTKYKHLLSMIDPTKKIAD